MSVAEDVEHAGFHVLEAATADEALKVLEAHPEIEAIISDIRYAGLDERAQASGSERLGPPRHGNLPDVRLPEASGE